MVVLDEQRTHRHRIDLRTIAHTCSAAIQRPEKSPGLRSATARTPSA